MISSTVSFSAINTELGNSSTATVSLNDANPRWLSGVPSGTISASNFVGTAREPGTLTATYYYFNNLRSAQFVSGKLYLFAPSSYLYYTTPTVLSSSSPSVNTSYTPQYFPNANGINKTAVNGTTIVGVSGSGHVYKTTDGTNWSSVLVYAYGLYAITWIPAISKYIAAGPSKTIYTSSDAVSWTQQTSPSGGNSYDSFVAIASSGSVHIIVGSNNFVARSTNTTTWTKQTGPGGTYTTWGGATWTGSLFVIVGSDGKIATSADGITWTLRFTAASGLNNVEWNGSLLVAIGNSGYVATSPDGITWTVRTTSFGSQEDLYALCWSGSAWFACGRNIICTSTNGITWTRLSTYIDRSGSQIVQSNNLASTFFVLWDSAQLRFFSSVDGITWTQRTPDANFYCNTIEYLNSIWIAVGYHSSYGAGVYTSSDGITWTLRATPAGTSTLRSIAYSGSRYVAVGESGTVISSADLITWTNHSTANYELWCGVAWNGSKFLVVDDDSIYFNFQTTGLSSSNGTTWTTTIHPNIGPMKSIASNGSDFFISSLGYYEPITMYKSSNATTITQDTAIDSQSAGNSKVWWNGYDIWAGHDATGGLYRRERNGSAWVNFAQTFDKIFMIARAPTAVVSQTYGLMVWNGSTITTRV